jgi:hypothetical protein
LPKVLSSHPLSTQWGERVRVRGARKKTFEPLAKVSPPVILSKATEESQEMLKK